MGNRPFNQSLIIWQKKHGRHGLPWQNTHDPYFIWLSEIMLQQTRVETVIPYFQRFVKRLPTLSALARARETTVLSLWSGLGYYSRARNIHTTAKKIQGEFRGRFPRETQTLQTLPGVGGSTAAAIAVFACAKKEAILDGNVKRVLTRYFGIAGYPENPGVKARLLSLAEQQLPNKNIRTYSQALMDLGAMVCTRASPDCATCPVNAACHAFQTGSIPLFPEKKKRSALPHRKVWMAVIVLDGCLLLERRPPKGIWGGLWSLPEAQSQSEIPRLIKNLTGGSPFIRKRLSLINHTFTHFHLAIHPEICTIKSIAQQGYQSSRQFHWLRPDEPLSKFGLPAPIKRILAFVRHKNPTDPPFINTI